MRLAEFCGVDRAGLSVRKLSADARSESGRFGEVLRIGTSFGDRRAGRAVRVFAHESPGRHGNESPLGDERRQLCDRRPESPVAVDRQHYGRRSLAANLLQPFQCRRRHAAPVYRHGEYRRRIGRQGDGFSGRMRQVDCCERLCRAACGGICTGVRSGRRICRCIAAPAVPGHSLRNRRGDFFRSSRR